MGGPERPEGDCSEKVCGQWAWVHTHKVKFGGNERRKDRFCRDHLYPSTNGEWNMCIFFLGQRQRYDCDSSLAAVLLGRFGFPLPWIGIYKSLGAGSLVLPDMVSSCFCVSFSSHLLCHSPHAEPPDSGTPGHSMFGQVNRWVLWPPKIRRAELVVAYVGWALLIISPVWEGPKAFLPKAHESA